MTVTVSLRQNQNTPLTWLQVDTNFSTLANAANVTIPQGGSTAARPGLGVAVLYQTYFDTTLGFPVFCSQISPSVTWVDAAGVTV